MPRPFLARLLALACAVLLAGAAQLGAAATAQVTIEVPKGKAKIVRLRHLPRGTLIGVAISASARLALALKSARQIRTKSSDAVFRGVLARRMSFKVVIPETDDYYLVLDNRRGAEPVKATATIQAVAGKKQAPAPGAPVSPKGGKLDETRAPGSAAVAIARL
jgi:hypothetical protein